MTRRRSIRYAVWLPEAPVTWQDSVTFGGGRPGRLAACPLCEHPLAREVYDQGRRYIWLLLESPVRVPRLEWSDKVQFWGRRERAMQGHSALRSGDHDPVRVAAQLGGFRDVIAATMAADYEPLVPDPVDTSCPLNGHRVRIKLPSSGTM